jgi:hypothetical protein
MKLCAAWLVLTTLMFCQTSQPDSGKPVALPNPGLFHCAAMRLWQDEKPQPGEIYPERMFVDHFDKDGCPQGLLALYNKSTSLDEIRAAINQRYGQWSKGLPQDLWRVEPERFAIQLVTIKGKKNKCMADEEMRQLIYLSFDVGKTMR